FVNSGRLRGCAWSGLKAIGRGIRWFFVTAPRRLARVPRIAALLEGYAFVVVRRFILKPVAVGLLVWALGRAFGLVPSAAWWLFGIVVLACIVGLATTAGKWAEAQLIRSATTVFERVRHGLVEGALRLMLDLVRSVRAALEQVSYQVDERLRYRQGDPRVALVSKVLFGSLWSVISYVMEFVINLLVEPQVNPIKHFPVVTVSHKVLLSQSAPVIGLMGPGLGATFLTLAPGLVGFLVWELSSNWRLYAASRPTTLQPARLGPHGETGAGLLMPGFHSGSVPKAFRGLRVSLDRGDTTLRKRHQASLDITKHALTRFFERRLVPLLTRAGLPMTLHDVQIGVAHFSVTLRSEEHPGDLCIVVFEQDGRLQSQLGEPALSAAATFAVRGVLARAGVDGLAITWRDWAAAWG
ncbi:MAG: hypothetical protein ACI9OJ_001977, partial [Myxococcota bacterium]